MNKNEYLWMIPMILMFLFIVFCYYHKDNSMSHIHELENGVKTGLDIPGDEDTNLHSHSVGDSETSSAPYGPSHTHIYKGITTSVPSDA